MLERLRRLRSSDRGPEPEEEVPETSPVFTALRLFSAELILSSGANATLHYLRGRNRAAGDARAGSLPARARGRDWTSTIAALVPLALGAAASAAQVRLALDPTPSRQTASTLLSGAVVGLGLASAADTAASAARGRTQFSLTPLLFGYAGVLGFLLDRQEAHVADEEHQLERRARIVERFVPKRRTKVERIVVHV